MFIDELDEEQRFQLKQDILFRRNPKVSYGDLADADNLISDEELRDEYGDISFYESDFWL